jgi:allantoicase
VSDAPAASFTGLVDLASAELGGKTLGASDEFFAEMDNLLKPGRAQFIPGKYTDRGKWMDGWESRRRRGPGHDYCVIKLGVAGQCAGFDIDTQHFLGNHPPFASVDGVLAPPNSTLTELLALPWHELLPQSALRPGSQNLFAAVPQPQAVSHLRLNIFPDGGVARFRAFGRVQPQWATGPNDPETRAHVTDDDLVDLVALRNGGRALACSDAFFGPMHNLLLPGRAADMGGGWETRRKRAPGHDWILLELGARGCVRAVEVDTHHFKGNYPDRCSIECIDAPRARITDLIASAHWASLLPEMKLSAHTRHFFVRELGASDAVATHVRLNIMPDGGVSRLRLWGTRHA